MDSKVVDCVSLIHSAAPFIKRVNLPIHAHQNEPKKQTETEPRLPWDDGLSA
jgi:hypothetical protein